MAVSQSQRWKLFEKGATDQIGGKAPLHPYIHPNDGWPDGRDGLEPKQVVTGLCVRNGCS